MKYERWSKYLAGITALLVMVGPIIYRVIPEGARNPKGNLGLFMGGVALVLILYAGFYSVRRARLWLRWGKIEYWLSLHTYLGILAVLFVLLHADWRFRPGAATAALVLLILVTISGVVGWAIYLVIPGRISSEAEEVVTPEETYFKLEKVQGEIDKLERRRAKQDGDKAAETDEELRLLAEKIALLEKELKNEFRQEAALGTWLYIHIPLSAALIVVACVHAFMTLYL